MIIGTAATGSPKTIQEDDLWKFETPSDEEKFDREMLDKGVISSHEADKRTAMRKLDYWYYRLTGAIWIGLAVLTTYQTNYLRTIFEAPCISRIWIWLGIVCLAASMLVLGVLAWSADQRNMKLPINQRFPVLGPMYLVLVGFQFLFFLIGSWPVYRGWTIIIHMIYFMGVVSSGFFLPNNLSGIILGFAVFVISSLVSLFIRHAPDFQQTVCKRY